MRTTDNDNNCQDIVSDSVNDVSKNAIDINVIKDLNVDNDCNVLNDADVLIDGTLNGLDQEDPRVIEAVLQRLIRSPDKTTQYNFSE